MKQLPFKTSPKPQKTTIGNAELGEIEITKLYGLTPLELEFIEETQSTLKIPDLRLEIAKLAEVVAKKSEGKIGLIDAFNALAQRQLNVIQDYLAEFVEVTSLYEKYQPQIDLIRVTAVLKYRLDNEWTLEDSKYLSPGLVYSINQFINQEETGEQDTKPITEDDIKSLTFESEDKAELDGVVLEDKELIPI